MISPRSARIDWSLYVLLDLSILPEQSVRSVARAVLDGGATALQLRAKGCSVRQQLALAQALLPLAHEYGVPLLINDHVDVTLAADADGVHLGVDDMPVALARRLLPGRIIGYSPEGVDDACRAAAEGADYLGVGPFAVTGTKPDAGAAIGAAGLSGIVAAVAIPVVAVGGITGAHVAQALAAGAAGVAVASAVVASPNPHAAARSLRSAIDNALSLT